MKKAILLVNLGTPDAPERGAVYRYLKEFLLDRRVIDIPWLSRNLLVRGIIAPFRSGASSKLYKKLWTPQGSPLKIYGEKLTAMVQERVGEEYKVALAMRYQNPSIESVLNKLLEKPVKELIVLPLFPHYASASSGSVYEEVMRILAKKEVIPNLRFIADFYDYDKMIDVFAEKGNAYQPKSWDHVLFSYHGLPERQILKADACGGCLKENCCSKMTDENAYCYKAQCYATTRAIVQKLGLKEENYTVCFQSRLGKTPWIKPYTTEILKERAKAGDKTLLVFCPAFVADCLETTIEVSEEYFHEFKELGGEKVQLVESLNDSPAWADAVCELLVGRKS